MQLIYAEAIFSFYALLLQMLHWVLALKLAIDHATTCLLTFYKNHINGTFYSDRGFAQMMQSDGNLKLPSHLGVIVSESDISFEHIIAILIWCFGIGISFVSLYDQQGRLVKSSYSIQKLLQQKCEQLFNTSLSNLGVQLGVNDLQNLGKNGRNIQTRIALLDGKCGRQSIVTAVRKLCHDVADGKQSKDVNSAVFRKYLHASNAWPDPELVLIFGPAFSTVGYLPWQLRLTEIMHLHTHYNITHPDLYNALLRYNRCEQRFGK